MPTYPSDPRILAPKFGTNHIISIVIPIFVNCVINKHLKLIMTLEYI